MLLVAPVIPAPTRTLYASNKGASLVVCMPSTVQAHRASAVDAGVAGPVSTGDPNTHGFKLNFA
jgi:hypothetical protein